MRRQGRPNRLRFLGLCIVAFVLSLCLRLSVVDEPALQGQAPVGSAARGGGDPEAPLIGEAALENLRAEREALEEGLRESVDWLAEHAFTRGRYELLTGTLRPGSLPIELELPVPRSLVRTRTVAREDGVEVRVVVISREECPDLWEVEARIRAIDSILVGGLR